MRDALEVPPGLEVQRYADGELPQHLEWQAVSFMRAAWPWIEGGKPRHTYDGGLRPIHFVVVDGEVLVSYAATIALTLEHAGETYAARGLGNVFTYPSSGGQGHGGRVVAAATADIQTSCVDVGALFCEHALAGFYGRHGWQAMDGAVTLTGPRGAPRVHEALRMMLFTSEKGRKGQAAFQTDALHVEHGW